MFSWHRLGYPFCLILGTYYAQVWFHFAYQAVMHRVIVCCPQIKGWACSSLWIKPQGLYFYRFTKLKELLRRTEASSKMCFQIFSYIFNVNYQKETMNRSASSLWGFERGLVDLMRFLRYPDLYSSKYTSDSTESYDVKWFFSNAVYIIKKM